VVSDERAAKLAEQKQNVKSACQSCGCWIGIIAGVVAASAGVLVMLKHSVSPEGPNVVVFMYAKQVRDQMIVSAIFAPFVLLLPLGTIKSTARAVLVGGLILAAMISGAWFTWYHHVAAIAVNGDDVELQFVWPRPNVHLTRGDIRKVAWKEDTDTYSDPISDTYWIEIDTGWRHYATFENQHFPNTEKAMKLLGASAR